MPNLEGQLGELTGHLKALVPVLDRVEDRQAEADKKAAAAGERLDALRSEFNDLRARVSNRVGEHYKSINAMGIANQQRSNEIETLRRDLEILKAKNDGVKQKVWDLLKIIVTIVLTVVATKLWST
jgi:chromosome segregation ATPase